MITVSSLLFRPTKGIIPPRCSVYTPEWMDKLVRGVKRNYEGPVEFLCLTDYPEGSFEEEVKVVPFLPDTSRPITWWNFSELARPSLQGNQMFLMGLDTVVLGSLSNLFSYRGPSALLSNFVNPHIPSNGLASWNEEGAMEVWKRFLAEDEILKRRRKTKWAFEDRLWARALTRIDFFDVLFPHQVAIYFEGTRLHPETRLVAFTRKVKPHNCEEDRIRENWI